MPRLHVVLDANVLFPAALRELLLNLSDQELYYVHWQEEILDETRRNLVEKAKVTEESADRLIKAMRGYFLDASVDDYKGLEQNLGNHPKDRHVLAAAVASGSQTIVTFNLKDFPAIALAPHNIEAVLPDTFLSRMFLTEPKEIIQAIQNQATRLKNPPLTVSQVLDALAKHAPNFVELVRQEIGLS